MSELECYVLKFNVGPTILELYEEQRLIKEIIPSSLGKIFEEVSVDNGIIEYRRNHDIKSIVSSELYLSMLEQKNELIEEFNRVVNRYSQTKEIIYREDYMDRRTRLKSTIEQLFEHYPFLKNSDKIKITSFSRGKIPEVRMGVTFIDRVKKIEKFLDSNIKLSHDLNFYYDCSKEWIYIPCSQIKGDDILLELQLIIDEIQEEVNEFRSATDIGRISINPIYDDFTIQSGKYKEITIKRVFPNGNPARDRGNALRAASEETKYLAAEDDDFTSEDITKETKDDAQSGYIAYIRSKAKNIIKNTVRKTKIHLRGD